MDADNKYWFPAKRYGFGWGPPVRWQGWSFVLLWAVSFFTGIREFRSRSSREALFQGCMIALLVWVWWLKGERPARWRWGDKD
jgi:hypothetical protein